MCSPLRRSRARTMAACHAGLLGNSIGTHVCFREETGTPPPQHLWVAGTL